MAATTIECPYCRARLRLQQSWSKVRCPRCESVIDLPSTAPESPTGFLLNSDTQSATRPVPAPNKVSRPAPSRPQPARTAAGPAAFPWREITLSLGGLAVASIVWLTRADWLPSVRPAIVPDAANSAAGCPGEQTCPAPPAESTEPAPSEPMSP
jgi:hypothetical protein